MGLFEHWPYVNFHELNLDWLVKKIPEVFEARDEAQASAEAAASSAESSQGSADQAAASAASAGLSAEAAAASAESAADDAQSTIGTAAALRSEMSILNTRMNNIIASGTPTEGNAELIDIRTAFNGISYQTAGDATRGQADLIYNAALCKKYSLYKSAFIHSLGFTGSGGDLTSDTRARCSVGFNTTQPVKVVANGDIEFRAFDAVNNVYLDDAFNTVHYYNNLSHAVFVLRPIDTTATALTSAMINSIDLYSNEAGYEELTSNLNTTIENTQRCPSFGNVGIVRYGMPIEGDYEGMLERGHGSYRATSIPFEFKNDTDIFVGRRQTTVMNIFKNGTYETTLNEGDIYHVLAGDSITFEVHNSETNNTNPLPQNVVFVSKDSMKLNIAQSIDATYIDRADAAFMVGDKVFMIAQSSYQKYSVKLGSNFLVDMADLDHDPGHANSCNYDPDTNRVYVSDWYNPIIHVYEVDGENNSLTYERDIELPPVTGGSVEYFVFDNEKQIFFIGWNDNTAAVRAYLEYGLFVKDGDNYTLSYKNKASRPTIMQGMTKVGDYLYYIDNNASYKTIEIARINIATGETEHNKGSWAGGSIMNYETEAIIPLSDPGAFMIVDSRGRNYVVTFME